jgi:hypothetical protein
MNMNVVSQVKYDMLSINDSKGDVVFKITHDGSLYYREVDSTELKKVECETELTKLFVSVISNYAGIKFESKEELYKTIATNYRNGNIDTIFKK